MPQVYVENAKLRIENERLSTWVIKMRAALLAAANQFATYADYHLAKTPPDREKAAANAEWSARCREASGEPP